MSHPFTITGHLNPIFEVEKLRNLMLLANAGRVLKCVPKTLWNKIDVSERSKQRWRCTKRICVRLLWDKHKLQLTNSTSTVPGRPFFHGCPLCECFFSLDARANQGTRLSSNQKIKRARNGLFSIQQHMSIDHRRANIGMP